MKTEQRIIALGVILASFISCNHSNAEDCPSSPCCENKPKLGPHDKLELGLFFDQYREGCQAVVDLSDHVCKLMKKCGKQISMEAIPGALMKEVNGKIKCPENFCTGGFDQVCSAMIDPEYGTSCKEAPLQVDIEECKAARFDEISNILIENGKKREKLGIPECKLPTLTFNGVFDLCASISSYHDLLKYVCELYDNKLKCCKS